MAVIAATSAIPSFEHTDTTRAFAPWCLKMPPGIHPPALHSAIVDLIRDRFFLMSPKASREPTHQQRPSSKGDKAERPDGA